MINYTQEISNLDIDNKNAAIPNLITGIHMLITAIDDTDNISACLGLYIGLQPSQDFISFQDITKEIVEGWISINPAIENAKNVLAQEIVLRRENAMVSAITIMPPWVVIPTAETTSSSTGTVVESTSTPSLPTEEHIKALIYRVLDEIETSKI